MELGRLVTHRMKELGLDSQTEAAKLLCVTQSTLNRWVGGSVVPSDGAVPALAEFLQLPEARVAELLYNDRREKLLAKERALAEDMSRQLPEWEALIGIPEGKRLAEAERRLVELTEYVRALARQLERTAGKLLDELPTDDQPPPPPP